MCEWLVTMPYKLIYPPSVSSCLRDYYSKYVVIHMCHMYSNPGTWKELYPASRASRWEEENKCNKVFREAVMMYVQRAGRDKG